MKQELEDFLDWVHNNWYEPTGYDGYWRLKIEDEEFEQNRIEIPTINEFSSIEVVKKYLDNQGIK